MIIKVLSAIRTLFCWVFLLSSLSLWAQPKIVWEKKIPTSNHFNGITTSHEGHIVAVGSVVKQGFGKDIAFTIVNAASQILTDTIISGGRADDEATTILPTDDGGYLLAGYTESPRRGKKGGRDGWLLKVDENGQPLWDKLLGTPQDDQLTALAADPFGKAIYAAGTSGDDFWLHKLKPNGQPLINPIKFGGKKAQVTALLVSEDGKRIYFIGYEKPEGYARGYVAAFDTEGVMLWEKTYDNAAFNAATFDEKTGRLLLTGATIDKKNHMDMLLLVADVSDKGEGTEMNRYHFGGIGDDAAKTIVSTLNGSIFLLGSSKSKARGQKFTDLCLVKTDITGEKDWEKLGFYGGNGTDLAESATLLPDGNLVAVGATDNDAWVVNFGYVLNAAKATPTFAINEGRFMDEERNVSVILETGKRYFYECLIANTSEIDAMNVGVSVKQVLGVENLSFSPFVAVKGGIRAGATKRVSVPFSSMGNLVAGKNVFELGVCLGQNQPLLTKHNFEFNTAKQGEAQLSWRIEADKTPVLTRKTTQILRGVILNEGSGLAQSMQLICAFPPKILALTDLKLVIDPLKPNGTFNFEYRFVLESGFESTDLKVLLSVKNTEGGVVSKKEVLFKVESLEIAETKAQEQAATVVNKNQNTIKWKDPDVEAMRDLQSFDTVKIVPIKVVANSPKPIVERNFHILINGKEGINQAKFDNVRLDKKANANNIYSYVFSANLLLSEGSNRVEVLFENEAGTAKTEVFDFVYDTMPHLHVLAIGVPAYNLKYTGKDALDLTQVFKRQSNLLYSRIFSQTLTDSAQTTYRALTKTFADLKDNTKIRPRDVLMVFISTHGKSEPNRKTKAERLFLETSDTDHAYLGSTAINYEDHILQELEAVTCKKVLLIDACFSGTASNSIEGAKASPDEDVNKAIQDLMQAQVGLRCITSSSAKEFSYEYAEGENGAFTEAILEAFENKKVPTNNGQLTADINLSDGIINLRELYSFVSQRVPYLVNKATKGQPQNPILLPKNAPDLPLFVLKK